MKKLLLSSLLALLACQGAPPSAPPSPDAQEYQCDETHLCPAGKDCLPSGSRYCCGGVYPCNATSFYSCAVPADCQAGTTCVANACVIDPGQDLTPLEVGRAPGCVTGLGYELIAGKAYACPGAFDRGEIASLCSTGYSPCSTSSAIRQFSGRLRHFFASINRGNQPQNPPSSQSACGWNCPASNVHYVYGMGGIGQPKVWSAVVVCSGFPTVMECDSSGSPGWLWRCPLTKPNSTDTDFDNLANDIADDGTLCCAL